MTARIAATICLTLLGVSGLILARSFECTEHAGSATPAAPPAATTAMAYRGLAVQVQSGYQPVEHYVPLFREIAERGANTVLLCAAGFMEHAESQMIFIEARKTPSPEQFKAIIRIARDDLDCSVFGNAACQVP